MTVYRLLSSIDLSVDLIDYLHLATTVLTTNIDYRLYQVNRLLPNTTLVVIMSQKKLNIKIKSLTKYLKLITFNELNRKRRKTKTEK